MAATFAARRRRGLPPPRSRRSCRTRRCRSTSSPASRSHYATVMQRRGDAVGLLVESPRGAPDEDRGQREPPVEPRRRRLVTQASILDLYDPERSTTPRKGGAPATWDDFEKERSAPGSRRYDRRPGRPAARADAADHVADGPPHAGCPRPALPQGARAHVVGRRPTATRARARASPSAAVQRRARARPRARHPVARQRLPPDRDRQRPREQGLRGRPPAPVVARPDEPAVRRRAGPDRSRATAPTTASACRPARRRGLRLRARGRAGEERHVDDGHPGRRGQVRQRGRRIPPKWLRRSPRTSPAARARAVIVVGSRQPPSVHALVHALNVALGAVGATVNLPPGRGPGRARRRDRFKALTDAIAAKQVEGLVILGGNPVYDAPADLAFADRLAKVPFTVHASLFFDETSDKCTWHVPRAHELESWGDGQALDGTVGLQQPLIAPLYAGRSDIELLAWMAKAPEKTGHEAVLTTSRNVLSGTRA